MAGVATLVILLLTTPLGQAIAQEIVSLFTRAESNTIVIESTVPYSTPTNLPRESQINTLGISTFQYYFPLDVSETEKKAGFDIYQILDSEKYQLLGLQYNSELESALSMYGIGGIMDAPNGIPVDGALALLYQSPSGFDPATAQEIGLNAKTETVIIAGSPGEYAIGSWQVKQNSNHRLRWKKDGYYFELTIYPFQTNTDIWPVSKEEVIHTAENLVIKDAENTPVIPLAFYSEFNLTIEEAEKLVGYPALVPTNMPREYIFVGIKFESQINKITQLYFLPNPGLVMDTTVFISQQSEYFEDAEWSSLIGPKIEVKTVTIGDIEGYWVQGGWLYVPKSTQGGEKPGDTITQEFQWKKNMVPIHRLRWQRDGFYFEIAVVGSDTQEGYLWMEDVVKIAEGME